MSFLWDLVHILQIIRYETFLNIDFPWNVKEFSKLLNFASGEFEEID